MPAEFNFEALAVAQKSYERLIHLCLSVEVSNENIKSDLLVSPSQIIKHMLDYLENDLNTPGCLGVIFEHFSEIAEDKNVLAAVKFILQHVLGLTLQPLPVAEIVITPEMQKLIDERIQARHEKNWKRADELRDQLKAMGFEVKDGKI